MRVMFSNMDPASRYNEKANLIVTVSDHHMCLIISTVEEHYRNCKSG